MVNPILPEQEGTNRYDLTDKNGVKIIQSIMKTAESGGGFNEFYFTKSDGKTVAPKVAYSKKLSYEKIKQHLCNNTLFSRTISRCRLIIVNAV